MAINGLYFITVRRYPHSKSNFLVDIVEERNEAARTESVESKERLVELLETFTPKDITLKQILEQVMLDPRRGEKMRKFQFCAMDTTPKN
jgi:hypothetical protein